MSKYKCKMCGAALEPKDEQEQCTCESCGCVQSISSLKTKKLESQFKRGSDLMRSYQFDEAEEKLESIINTVTDNPEVFWNVLMCRFGVVFEKDPITSQMVPTIHRSQNNSIFLDGDYNNAIKYANDEQKEFYEKTAQAIDKIQQKYNDIIEKEKPYDIFICYKQKDEKRRDTQDYQIAFDLYNELTGNGYKVFFSHVSLEDKAGEEYEPYIYAALQSSKIMISIGTNNKNYESVWVKNEWHRFLIMMKEDVNKLLIPLCNSSDDLPEEFSRLQAIQMNNNVVWKQDLIRQISKNFKDISNNNNDVQNDVTYESTPHKIKKLENTRDRKDNKPKVTVTKNTTPEKVSNKIGKVVLGIIMVSILAVFGYTIIGTENNNATEVDNSSVEEELVAENNNEVINESKDRIVKTEIRIRSSASQNSNIVGHVYMGDIIEVLETKNSGGYTWYRIGTNQWVADTGYWTEPYNDYLFEDSIKLDNLKVGSYFTYGKFEQDNNTSNGSEDIYWKVLAVQNDRILVISKYALDCTKYNDTYTNWQSSSVRGWLNEGFLNSSFNYKELEKVLEVKNKTELNNEDYTRDKVFLLSMTEIEDYMPNASDRVCEATAYAISRGAHQYEGSKATWWWLRTMNADQQTVLNIRTSGDLRYVDAYPNSDGYCVRPAMWLSLK